MPVDNPRRPVVDPADRWHPSAAPWPGQPGRRGRRAWLLLVGGGLVLLLVGFLAGAALTGGGSAATAVTVATGRTAPPEPVTASSAAPGTGQVPAQCVAAIDRADQAISYLVANIRDQRLTRSMLAFVASRQACLDLTTR